MFWRKKKKVRKIYCESKSGVCEVRHVQPECATTARNVRFYSGVHRFVATAAAVAAAAAVVVIGIVLYCLFCFCVMRLRRNETLSLAFPSLLHPMCIYVFLPFHLHLLYFSLRFYILPILQDPLRLSLFPSPLSLSLIFVFPDWCNLPVKLIEQASRQASFSLNTVFGVAQLAIVIWPWLVSESILQTLRHYPSQAKPILPD